MRLMKMLLLSVFVIANTPVTAGAFQEKLADGTYEGEYSFVRVAVTVEDGRVGRIDMVEHGGGGARYARMVEPLTLEMVREQTLDVDTVTGATVSSDNLKKAVQDALKKAAF